MHAELDKVIGTDRMITVADKILLPYTQAVVMETQRLCNLISSNLLRKTSKEIQVNGMRIPKGTIMIPQISTVMADPKVSWFGVERVGKCFWDGLGKEW